MTIELNAAARLRTQVKAEMDGQDAVKFVKDIFSKYGIKCKVRLVSGGKKDFLTRGSGGDFIEVGGPLLGQTWEIRLRVLSDNAIAVFTDIGDAPFNLPEWVKSKAESFEATNIWYNDRTSGEVSNDLAKQSGVVRKNLTKFIAEINELIEMYENLALAVEDITTAVKENKLKKREAK